MVDKVRPFKRENSTTGTENDKFQTEVDPNEDYLSAKGVSFEESDDHLIDTDESGNIRFKDSHHTEGILLKDIVGFRHQSPQFQFIGQLAWSDQYLYNHCHSGGEIRRSGDASNGYRYSNSSPTTCAFNGTVVQAACSITGVAQSEGSPAATVTILFELWNVGFNGEGTKLGDITFDVDSGAFTIGNYGDSSILTALGMTQAQNVPVVGGDLLGLKFKAVTGNSNVIALQNVTVALFIEGIV